MSDRSYHREYSRNYYYKQKQKYAEILGGKCIRCGSTEKLHFDHIDHTSKKFAISRLLNYSQKEVLEELSKCQLLCEKCHLLKTQKEGSLKVEKPCPHGSLRRYYVYKCRCDICIKTHEEYNKKRREKRKNGGLPER